LIGRIQRYRFGRLPACRGLTLSTNRYLGLYDHRKEHAEPAGGWGDVPDDGEVRPFSKIPQTGSHEHRRNRSHHYISVTYMNGFRAQTGKVWAHYADNPGPPHASLPIAVGYRNHYYSHALEGGGRDNHTFEDLWNSIEGVWDTTMRAVRHRRLSLAISFNILGMAAIMRARVPAARDKTAIVLAAKLRAEVQGLRAREKLPDDLLRYADELNTVPIGINPDQTLRGMNDDLAQFGDLCFVIGFEVLHNTTALPFITSDNPVCVYDPRVLPAQRIPYSHDGQVEVIFPLDARTLLRGSGRLSPHNRIVRHRDLSDRRSVRDFNRTIAQFAYQLAIASDRSSDLAIAAELASSPTVEVQARETANGLEIHWNYAFGARPKLSPYINTPEKAARLEAQMATARGRVDSPKSP
jgi:hypothetical protein